MDFVKTVDGCLPGRGLIFGSLPPSARDLDIVVPDEDLAAFHEGLARSGFRSHGHTWARFVGCRADVVDAVPASDWRLTPSELDRLFADAIELAGCHRLVRPAPHHVLLILALRVTFGARDLGVAKRDRIDRATTEAASAWDSARPLASAWGVSRALELLEASYHQGRSLTRAEWATSVEERGGRRSRWRALAGAAPSIGRPRVVTLSGLDGSGKSTQAEALAEMLTALGFEARVEWTRLAQDPVLDRVAGPVKRILGLRTGSSPAPVRTSRDESASHRGSFVTFFWTVVVATANALSHRRATRRHGRRGGITICDRYVLDSAVHMKRKYGRNRSYRFQIGLIRLLSPKPSVSYYLEVPPEVAAARKQDVYTLDQLRVHAALYEEMAIRERVIRIDGTQSKEHICETIGRQTWDVLAR